MLWLTRCVAALLLVLWVPVTMHCAMETLPGFGFLQWCCGGDTASAQGHNCDQDCCGAVESGCYKIEDNPAPTLTPVFVLTSAAWDWVAGRFAPTAPVLLPASSAPPELPRLWQFHYRAALPPRAPSLIA